MHRRKWLLGSAVLAALVLLAFFSFVLGRTPPPPPPPNPNGYDCFIAAAQAATGNAGDYSTLSHEALRALVVSNAEPLRLIRVGLTQVCAAPTASYMTNVSAMLPHLAELKRLVFLLAADGRLAELENRPAEAALSYAEAVHFGNEISRGGFLINRLVGVACGAIGCSQLAKLTPKLNCDQARPVLANLKKTDETRVTWEEINANERRFARAQLGRAFNPITWAMSQWQAWQSRRKAEVRVNRLVAHERLLAAELAARCYRSVIGHPPARLEDLVPDYFSSVPQDPFTLRPLVYRLQGTNWLLYSLGPDRVDDGGQPVGKGSTQGDILFDSTW